MGGIDFISDIARARWENDLREAIYINRRLRAELRFYMDQHRWLAQYNAASLAALEKIHSPARKWSEALLLSDRMERLRATYQQIELLQSALGLSTVEGASYG